MFLLAKGMASKKMRAIQFLRAAVVLLVMLALFMAAGCAPQPAPEEEAGTGAEEQERAKEAGGKYITLATTTSTYDSGLLDVLLPAFTEKYGIEVRVLSKGTGAAIELGKRGDVDVLLVHDRASELELVEQGYFTDRYDVMYNDFVIVGPPADPAGIKGLESAAEAFAHIAGGGHVFVSRGDDSGTHRMELSLWEKAGVKEQGNWYKEVGQGMGDTLRMASEMEAYTLTDRATYISLRDSLDLEITLEGDPALFNQYGIMAVNPEMHPHVKYDDAMKFINFFVSDEGQEIIASFQIEGESLFFPGKGVKD